MAFGNKKKKIYYSNIFTPESCCYYRENILAHSEDIVFQNDSELFLSDQQKEGLLAIQNNDRVAIKSGKGPGKCIKSGEDILLADGSYVTVDELENTNFLVPSLNKDGKTVIKEAFCFDNGVKECTKITTSYGKELTRTTNHPLLTLEGWKQIDELKVGDYIAIPKELDLYTNQSVGHNKMKFLAYIIADGGITSSVKFTKSNPVLLEEFRTIVSEEFECELSKQITVDNVTYAVIKKEDKNNTRVPNLAKKYLEEVGLMGKDGHQKNIPDIVYKAPLDEIAVFLSRLFSCDGWVYAKEGKRRDTIEVGYCSVSKELIKGIQRLLLRFGIVSKIRIKKTSHTHKGIKHHSTAYCIELHDKESINTFFEKIGIFGKDDVVNKAKEFVNRRIINNKKDLSKYDYFPGEIFKTLESYISKRDLRYKYNIRPSVQARIGRKILDKICKENNISFFDFYLNASIGWDQITSIENVGEYKTFGIEVKDTHNYIVDVCEHNTALVVHSILWFMNCHANPKVIVTAPTYGTLKTALWPELSMWHSRSLVKDIYEITDKSMYLIESPRTWITLLRTCKDADAAQGAHAENLLIITDESSGIKQEIFEAFDSTLTGKNNKFVMIGNPMRVSGPFYDAFHGLKHRWVNLTFNAEESPFVKRSQIEYYENKYGRHHDIFRTMVLGEFPKGSPDAFIDLSSIHAAVDRWDEVNANGVIEIGIDVARFGDDLTVLYWRHGYKVYPAKILAKSSITDCRDLVYNTVDEIRKLTGYEKKIRVKVDDTGIGSGLTDVLREDRTHNIEVVPCNFGGAGNEKYQNEATIMWATVKDCINIIGLPEDQHLIEELSSRRFRMSPQEKIMIEPKSEYKKEFKSSPDRADALVLCFAQKEAENVVLKNLDVLDKNTIKELHYAGDEKFCSIFYGKDMTISLTYVAWDGARAYVYDEFVCDDSLSYVASNILQHVNLTEVIGNDRMFSRDGSGIDYKYRKMGIRVKECWNYNEVVGVDALMNITTQKKLVIHPGCRKTIEQLSSWRVDNKKVQQEREYGLCYSLAHTMFFLKKRKKNIAIPEVFEGYKPTTLGLQTKKSKSWMLT